MPVTKVTTPPPSATGAGQTGSVGTTGTTGASQPTPPSTSGDLSGAAVAPRSGRGDIFMQPPRLDTAALMVQMTALQSQLTDVQVKLTEESIKGQRDEMVSKQKERIKKLKDYFSSLAKKSGGGFFGKLVKAIKCVFKGDFKGFADNLGEAFSSDWVTGILFTAAMAFATVTMPGVGNLMVLAAFTPAMMGDAELMGMAADVMGLEGKARSDFLKATKWIGFSLEIAVTLVVGIAVSIATAGAAVPAVAAIMTAQAACIGAREAERGVRSYEATKEQAEGMEAGADADRLQADSLQLQNELDKNMGRLNEFYDSYTSIIKNTTDALQRQFQAQRTAASV